MRGQPTNGPNRLSTKRGVSVIDLWSTHHASVLSLSFLDKNGSRLSSGTGFKASSYLVTNNHVIQVPGAVSVVVRSVKADGYSTAYERTMPFDVFRTKLKAGADQAGWDYAILDIDDTDFASLPDFELTEADDLEIGRPIVLFGYQFDQPNLSLHAGYLSSQRIQAGVHYLQLDASVNNGNSGGPLLDIASQRVIGLVTRKVTGLTNAFSLLQQSFQQNIDLLSGRLGNMVSGIDFAGALRQNQRQMAATAKEIERSANVGIGYAFHIREVRQELTHQAGK
jgi:S1-C subfamily serine protease